MSSNRIVPYNTQSANLNRLRGTEDFDKDIIGDEDDKQTNQAAYNPLEWPKGLKNQLIYVVFFPVNFLFFFLFPNIVDSVSKGKVALMITIMIMCLAGIIILLLSIQFSVIRFYKIKYHILALFNALILVFP
jgi:hypothetical protein